MGRKSKKEIEQEQLTYSKNRKITWIITSIINFTLLFFAISKMGKFGVVANNVLIYLAGSLYIFPLLTLFAYSIFVVFFSNKYRKSIKSIIGLIVINIMLITLSSYIADDCNDFAQLWIFIKTNFVNLLKNNVNGFTGGIIGNFIYVCLLPLFEKTGTLICLIVLFIISMILIIPSETYRNAYDDSKNRINEAKAEKLRRKQEQEAIQAQKEEERKLKLAQEFNIEDDSVHEEVVQEEIIEDIHEQVIEENKVDTYSTNSPFLINLTADELKDNGSALETSNNEIAEDGTKQVTKQKILKVKRSTGKYHLPKPYEQFLDKPSNASSNINKTSASVKGEKVIEILANFGIPSSLINTYIGPSVTKFEIKPESNVKVNKINNISDNIKMELAAKDIRIEAPIPGRSAVGVEIPNVEPIPVKMMDLVKAIPSDKKDASLLFCLGKDLMGKPVYCDVSKMPHLLIAGATGSGKSVCINSIICSFLLRSNPDDVKLVLVDPKKVEFTPYKDIPHLLWPIIDDATMASNMLKKVVVMMEDRYDAFATVGVRNIQSFNEYVAENNAQLKEGESPMAKMPYIVIIIDELADLMAIAKKDVELLIQRITQLARASGIHLIVATQRPSTDVITGLIKSNIPSRISFAVASSIDSRTILDSTGAERLLGNGDMLYHPQGENAPMRLQGVYVTDKEIQKLTSFVKSQAEPQYEDSYFEFLTNMNGTTVMGAGAVDADTMDSLYDEVVEFVTEQQKASTSLLQRRFGIGYNRAARLIDTLEDRGIIGPANGSKPRDVYRKPDEE